MSYSLNSNGPKPVSSPGIPSEMSCSLNSVGPKPVDAPITLRKGIRNCTKHPISNHMSCKNLSPSFSVFISQLCSVDVPKNIQEAVSVPKWKEAIFEEMKALENNTWEKVNLPEEKTLVRCKWVFMVKSNLDESLERYKAKLVAKGLTQTYGMDY